MERTIGNLGQEIKQHSNPFTNLSHRAILRAQINSLKTLIPDLEPDSEKLPRNAIDLDDGFVLLPARDEHNHRVFGEAGTVLTEYIEECTGELFPDDMHPSLQRWARLRLPNGQIVRSAYKETLKALNKVRMSRNVRFVDAELGEAYAETQFLFQSDLQEDVTLALVSVYSSPDKKLLEESSKSLWVCKYLGDESLKIIDVKAITSVVAVVPFEEGKKPVEDDDGADGSDSEPEEVGERVFMVHKMGLEVGKMTGYAEEDPGD
ncbi:hypothetical protein C8F01DRAFT_991867 [Mycena amicta]|nr:hypothetical protein C8F01DRAFT_991867 [Mycena amicta]